MLKAFAYDLIAVAVFAVCARLAHGGLSPREVVQTWWPFAVGTLIAAIILIIAHQPAAQLLPSGLVVWVVTAISGLGIWGMRHGAVPHISFIIVATAISGLFILGWRGIAGVIARSRTVPHSA